MTKAMHRKLTKYQCKDVELFRNGTVHDFYRVKALITLEQVITSVVEKRRILMSKMISTACFLNLSRQHL